MGRFDGDRGVPHCLACPGRQTGVGEWLVGGLKQAILMRPEHLTLGAEG